MSVPKELEINQKVVDVDMYSGEKKYNSIPALVTYSHDKTNITWSANNLEAHQCLRFDF